MVADIAYRCALLNPHLGAEAALRSYGLVMIDEVDMHLHPQWQQTVMAGLLSAFPKIQFIVTTHSPQVLSTVERENIRLLDLDHEGIGIASIPLADSYGEPSHDVLQAIMQVDPQPPVPEKVDLKHLTALVDQGLYQSEQAQQLLASLKERLSPSHPQIERIERSIRRQEALAR
jgi:predicted ATP-binding protein involved in virulence